MASESEALQGSIVILEDSAPTRNILRVLLEKNKYKVLEFANGKLALEHLEKHPNEDVKLIISDVMMPEMDGFEFVKNLKEQGLYSQVPIVLATALSGKEDVLAAKKLGVTGYIVKPISVKKVLDVLKRLFPDQVFKEIA